MSSNGSQGAGPVAGERRFARFADGRPTSDGYWPLPSDGLCLSSFVVLSPMKRPGEVLVGRLDPSAPWARIGALDPVRVRNNSDGWMLPSCRLLYYETPEDAARRILTEQLGLEDVPLGPPLVHSETGPPRRHPHRGSHWDLEFLFRITVAFDRPPTHSAWRELRFVETATTPRAEFTRSHDEVLELAGFRFPG
jgi:ADP-ribose pyrophosphatase YjhB (NUDIX family)